MLNKFRTTAYFLMFLIIVFAMSLTVIAEEGSLWKDEAADMYQDTKIEYEVGDVITVIIEEDASAIQSADTNTSQASDINASPGFGFLQFLKAFGFNFSDSDAAEGETSRSGILEADITTRVEDVDKVGNVHVTGNKTIKINGEEQVIKLSGILRPQDIGEDNSVLSEKIADARIEYEGQGPVSEKQRPGLLSKLFNWIF